MMGSATRSIMAGVALLALVACDDAPATGGVPDAGVTGPAGGQVALAISVEASSIASIDLLTIDIASMDMVSDREPDLAPRAAASGDTELQNGFTESIGDAPPGAYSVFEIDAAESSTPALRLVVRLGLITVSVQVDVLPLLRLRCATPSDLGDGQVLDVSAVLNLDAVDSLLSGDLLPPPLGVTSIDVSRDSHPTLLDAVVDAIVTSWTVTCTVR